MTTQFRIRQFIDEINEQRAANGLPIVSDRAIAKAAGVPVNTLLRLTQNNRPSGQQLLETLDRLMDVLSAVALREVGPADLIDRVPNKQRRSVLALGRAPNEQHAPRRPPGRRPGAAK